MDVPYPILPGVECSACTQSFASAQKLAEHLRKKHELLDTAPQDAQNTTLCAHTKVLVRLLLLKSCLDDGVKYGDGDRLCTALKFMWPIFKLNNNYKYAMAVVQFLAQIQYCVSPQLAAQLKYDRFVNMKGKKDSNYPADLLVEHSNKEFKDNFSLFRGETTQKTLDRLSKSQTETQKILDNHQKEFATERFIGKHTYNKDLYEKDVKILYDSIRKLNAFENQNRLKTADMLVVDPVYKINAYTLQDWMRRGSDKLLRVPQLHSTPADE